MLSTSSPGSGVSRGRLLLAAAVSVVCLFGLVSTAGAATTITVNSATDAAMSSPSATCPATCSLREAVQVADYVGGASTITLPAGYYKLTLADTASGQTDNPAVGDLDVNSGVSLTLTGGGASSTTIDANHIDRAFAVHSGGSLSVSGVTVEHGAQPNTSPSNDSALPGDGGAFYNDGVLSISGSVLTGESAVYGGVIYTDTGATSTSITNSTVTENSASENGGVADIASGTVTLSGDTLTHNSSGEYGGAVYDSEGSGTPGAVTISGSTLSNNTSYYYGGALYMNASGALNIASSTMDGNADYEYGGAIYDSTSGNVTIAGSTISGDSTTYDGGGALYAYTDGTTTISGSTFDNDVAGDSDGGAVYVDVGTLAVSGSSLQDDSGEEGGAVYLAGTPATALSSITTSSFTGNLASDYDGGAVYDESGALSVSRSTFTNNDSAYYGGAFYYGSADGLALTNDTFDGNQSYEGGAIYLDEAATSGTIALLNDTVARNTGYEGGGIYYPQYANTIENTIVADNSGGSSADGGGDCYGTAATDNAASQDIGGNIDSDGTCFSNSVTGDHTGVNPDLGTLSANGGPMQTDALLTGSPAIADAIHSACPATDERGVTRPTACDAGAYQTAAADLSLAASVPGTGTIGAPLTYTLTVTNNGPGAATGVTVTDTLPAGVTLFGSTASQGSCSGTATVTCSLGTIDSSATGTTNTASVTITVLPTTAGSLSNSASVSETTTDPVSTNNTASATTTIGLPVGLMKDITPLAATGAASKVKSTQAYLTALVNTAGQTTTYTFQVRRQGTSGWRTVKGKTLVAGTTVSSVGFTVRYLKSGKKYFYRVRATSSIGTSYGQQVVFHTAAAKKKKKK
jgi:uncharacterized repeat protein (TIGR01451 family)/CSLREA domain-containing protein